MESGGVHAVSTGEESHHTLRSYTVSILILAGACGLALSSAVLGQDSDAIHKLLTQRPLYSCEEFIFNAGQLIPRYYEQGERDSINLIISFVDSACGCTILDDAKVLLSIESGSFPLDWCDSTASGRLFNGSEFENCVPLSNSTHFPHLCGTPLNCRIGFAPVDSGFVTFLQNLNTRMLAQVDTNTVACLVCHYYAGDIVYNARRLSHRDFAGTRIQDAYDRAVKSSLQEAYRLRLHYALVSGLWVPLGSNRILGDKIEIGGQFGIRWHRFGLDLTLAGRFLKAREPYVVKYQGSLRTTDHFSAVYSGVGPTFELFNSRKFQSELFSDVGYTDFDVIDSGRYSVTGTFGGSFRWFINKPVAQYLGLQIRYSIVKFDSGGGSDLSGNALSVDLILGWLSVVR